MAILVYVKITIDNHRMVHHLSTSLFIINIKPAINNSSAYLQSSLSPAWQFSIFPDLVSRKWRLPLVVSPLAYKSYNCTFVQKSWIYKLKATLCKYFRIYMHWMTFLTMIEGVV